MIVNNESARIERCLSSIKPYISSYVIVDTGSTDDTINKIKFTMNGALPGHVVKEPFVDYSTTRNFALGLARNSEFNFDYILLCDADMELLV